MDELFRAAVSDAASCDVGYESGAVRPDAFLQLIASRRSVAPRRLVAPGPSQEELARIVAAALTAPDHGALRPWRFLRIPDSRREDLAHLFGAAKREETPDVSQADLERAQGRARNAPALLTLILHPDEANAHVPVEEQYVSLGAALQNVLLAAHAMGFAAMMTSGRKVRTKALQQALCRPPERLVGFVSIGTPSSAPKPRASLPLSGFLADWEGVRR